MVWVRVRVRPHSYIVYTRSLDLLLLQPSVRGRVRVRVWVSRVRIRARVRVWARVWVRVRVRPHSYIGTLAIPAALIAE